MTVSGVASKHVTNLLNSETIVDEVLMILESFAVAVVGNVDDGFYGYYAYVSLVQISFHHKYIHQAWIYYSLNMVFLFITFDFLSSTR